MRYIYAALLLNASGSDITEETVTKVMAATGSGVDEVQVKALVAALSEVDIDDAIKTAPSITAAPVTAVTEPEKEPAAVVEEKEEEKEEEAIAGLGALFQ
jgi:large subunit ribosomal protein L12